MVFLHPGAAAHRQDPRRPGDTDVFVPPIRRRLQHGDPLPPQRRLAGELAPRLLPGGIGVQGEDQRADLAHPVPALGTPKIVTTRETPAATSASASKAPSHTHSGPSPACSAAALK